MIRNLSLFLVVYFVSVPMKFLIFYRNYAKVCELMKNIISKINDSSMQRVQNDEKGIEKAAKVVGAVFLLSVFPYVYHLIQTTPRNFFDVVTEIIAFPSGCGLEFINFTLQFVYFNFCIQICSLFKQMEDDIKDMKDNRDEKFLAEKLGKIVEFHNEVLQIISVFLHCFENILSLNFVLNIWLIGQSLVFSSDSDWIIFLLTSPFLLFEAWIFCYASQLIVTRVRKFS